MIKVVSMLSDKVCYFYKVCFIFMKFVVFIITKYQKKIQLNAGWSLGLAGLCLLANYHIN